MRTRNKAQGNQNLIGQRVFELRKQKNIKQKDLLAQLQVRGIDLSSSALSKIEGMTRPVYDKELLVLSQVLNVSVEWLLTGK